PSTSSAPTSCVSGTLKQMPYMTEERRMIQEQAREFTLNEVLPVANKLDPEKGDIPMDLRDKMAELGYFGILIPGQYGGLGAGWGPGVGLFRVLPGDRGTVARLDERRLADRPRQPPDRLADDERGAARPPPAPHAQAGIFCER